MQARIYIQDEYGTRYVELGTFEWCLTAARRWYIEHKKEWAIFPVSGDCFTIAQSKGWKPIQ